MDGCKVKRESVKSDSRDLQQLISVESLRLDSLYLEDDKSICLKMEFYPDSSYSYATKDIPVERIKAISIETNNQTTAVHTSASDSDTQISGDLTELSTKETHSTAKHDSLTILVGLVSAGILVYLLIKYYDILRKF
jgi:hypothetical protein